MQKTKKLFAIGLSCLTLMSSISLVACGEIEKNKHAHQYVETEIPATCQQEGYNLFTCECGDSYKGQKILAKTAHTGMITCNICGLNYFDEIKSLVIENGTMSNNGQYYYIGKSRSNNSTVQSTYISYDPSNMNLFLGLNYEMTSFNSSFDFMIMISHPSASTGLQTGKYTWMLLANDDSVMGTINGNTFSSLTNELTISYNDGFTSSVGSLAASFAKYTLTDAFIPLLKLSLKDISPANVGFVNFSL